MERKYRNSLLSLTCLLQPTLFTLFGHLPRSHGLNCYCSDEPSIGLPVCHWDNYMCSGDVCYVRRFLKNDVIYTKWGCLSYSNPMHHIDLICDDGTFNGATDHYACCTDRNNCNEHIKVVLPIERPTTTSVPTVATTNDGLSSGNGREGPSDPPATSSGTVPMEATTTDDLSSGNGREEGSSDLPATSSETVPMVATTTSLPPILRPTSTPSPNPTGLNCYCSDEPSIGFPLCHWDNYMCSGDVCYVRRFLKNGVIYTKWGCLSYSNLRHPIDLICDNGTFNGATDHYACCTDRNNCNQHIKVVLPIERPTTASVPMEAMTTDHLSSGIGREEGSSDPPATSSETVPIVATTTSLPPILRPTSTPSPNPTGSPQLKCYCSTCPSLEVTCGPSSSCFVHKDYNLGKGEAADAPFSLSWGCLNRSESTKKCHGQSKEYECCSHKDYCNIQLHMNDSADCNSMSGTHTVEEKEIIRLTQQLINSIADRDYKEYSKLCMEEMTSFEPETYSQLVSGMEFHKFYFDHPPANPKAVQQSIITPKVHMLGENAACIAYIRLVQSADKKGKTNSATIPETRIWQKFGKDWKCVHTHSSKGSSNDVLF